VCAIAACVLGSAEKFRSGKWDWRTGGGTVVFKQAGGRSSEAAIVMMRSGYTERLAVMVGRRYYPSPGCRLSPCSERGRAPAKGCVSGSHRGRRGEEFDRFEVCVVKPRKGWG
jgi:hypothetical protein